MQTFSDRLAASILDKGSILVVGLDPNIERIPQFLIDRMTSHYGFGPEAVARIFLEFNKAIIDATIDYAAAYKPQIAFYEAYGSWGLWAYEHTVQYLRELGCVVIIDAKRGDGGDTADKYAEGHLGRIAFPARGGGFERRPGPMRVDCMTVHGYIGDDCVGRFAKVVKEEGTAIFVVDKTSFKPNSRLEQMRLQNGETVWQALAGLVDEWGAGTEGDCGYRNVGVVMGATYPEDAPWMRRRLPNAWFLIPGFGAQSGDATSAIVGVNPDGLGGCVNSSRDVIFAYMKGAFTRKPEQFASAARDSARASRDALNGALRSAGKLAA